MSFVNSMQINFEQYGLTPGKLLAAWTGPEAPGVLANSIPKSGTNLLVRVLYLMKPLRRKLMRTLTDRPGVDVLQSLTHIRPGQIAAAHLYFSEELAERIDALGLKHLLMVRDPRDIAVSNAFYLARKDSRHRLYPYFSSLPSDSERLTAAIQGVAADKTPDGMEGFDLGRHLKNYLKWSTSPDCLIVRFEDLVGPEGGGARSRQLAALARIRDHLGLAFSDEELESIAQQVFDTRSRTFFKGQIGNWRNHFEASHKETFKHIAGNELLQLGYELDYDW